MRPWNRLGAATCGPGGDADRGSSRIGRPAVSCEHLAGEEMGTARPGAGQARAEQ